MRIMVEDLLFMPHGGRNVYMPLATANTVHRGAGTVLLLPDERTTALIRVVTDERWRMHGSKAIAVTAQLDGPAADLHVDALMALLDGKTGGGGWSWNQSTWGGTFSLAADAKFTVLAALPHTCGSQPGQPCTVRWGGHGRIVCDTPLDVEPVALQVTA